MSVFGTKSKWGGVRVDKRVCWQEKLEDEAEGMARADETYGAFTRSSFLLRIGSAIWIWDWAANSEHSRMLCC